MTKAFGVPAFQIPDLLDISLRWPATSTANDTWGRSPLPVADFNNKGNQLTILRGEVTRCGKARHPVPLGLSLSANSSLNLLLFKHSLLLALSRKTLPASRNGSAL